MVWHPDTRSYVETMARVQLDYFLASPEMATRCTMCRNTVMPEVMKRREAYTDHEMVMTEFELSRRVVRQSAPRRWPRLLDKNEPDDLAQNFDRLAAKHLAQTMERIRGSQGDTEVQPEMPIEEVLEEAKTAEGGISPMVYCSIP